MSFIFLNPFTMMIGGALIASPIIIHLINRMRFKRVRWAAMEFLLKAQKRSRKRMIIEQLLLLLLRILLVLLIALLLSRLIEKKDILPEPGTEIDKPPPQTTLHVVILDDTASMGDRWQEEEGPKRHQFTTGRDRACVVINDHIIGAVKDDANPHEIVIIKTSKTSKENKLPEILRITDQTQLDIKKSLDNDYKAEPFHYEFPPALKMATTIMDDEENKKKNLVLHIVSDFRERDWNDATKDSLGPYFELFKKAKIQVKVHDVISPSRDDSKALVSHENLAIVDFRPESPVAIKDYPIEFSVTVANYSKNEQDARVNIKVNNVERREGSVVFKNIPPNGGQMTKRAVFSLSKTAPKDFIGANETDRFDGFNLVSAELDNQRSGLTVDDIRYAVVEVRDKISMLLVDNNQLARGTKNAESFYLWKLFSDTYKGFDVEVKTAAEMEKMSLARFSAVVLCDIPTLTKPAIDKLESYLNAGGGVGFFMGPSIRDPKLYNDLWNNGKGMFPAPLKEIANKNATTEQLNQIQSEQRLSFSKKLVVRNEMRRDAALEKLYSDTRGARVLDTTYENTFYGVSFPRYYVVDRSGKFAVDDLRVRTLLYLQNNNSIANYEKDTRALLQKLRELTDEDTRRQKLQHQLDESKDETRRDEIKKKMDSLKADMEKYLKYQKVLKAYSDAIANTVGKYDNPLHRLVIWLDEVLLHDPGDAEKAPPVPSMIELWQDPDLADLKKEFEQLIDRIKFGDPFYIAKQYKKGRVLAFMGSAGMTGSEGNYWNSLDSISGQQYYPPLMKDSLQRYLCGTSGDFYLPFGKPFDFELETGAYEPRVRFRRLFNDPKDKDRSTFTEPVVKIIELGEAAGEKSQTIWNFTDGNAPGAYLLEFTPKIVDLSKKDAGRPDIRALTFNFDTGIESNLQRARSDDIKTIARVEKIEDASSQVEAISKEHEKNYPPDESPLGWSKSPWLFLGMLIVLILEQAWAVRLSFHTRENASLLNLPRGLTRGPTA